MTDFNRVTNYYKDFDEQNRLLKDFSGKFEYKMTMRILNKYISNGKKILDLGGASGIYTFPLAKQGNYLTLADLSPKLIEQAKEKIKTEKINNIISCDVENAVSLSYPDEEFDIVLLFGPLYHLLEKNEREKCIKEVYRVLKNGGLVFASFIPYLSGSIAIIDRYFRHHDQVTIYNLEETFKSGKFINNSSKGFQEGYYPKSEEIVELFNKYKFSKIDLLSIRGIGYEKEDDIYNIDDKDMYNKIIKLIDDTCRMPEVIEMCGHAMYIGKKF